MRWAPLLLGLGLFTVLPADAGAQEQRCQLLPGAREANRQVLADGRSMVYISGPAEFACPDGTSIVADSAVGEQDSGELDLIGNVVYTDSLKMLVADQLNYQRTIGRLHARGRVVLTDRESGSEIRGEELIHLLAQEDRPESHSTMRGGRPHATIHERTDSTATAATPEDSAAGPVEIEADLMEIRGEAYFEAKGNVALARGETRGYGDAAELDQHDGRMLLTGDARVEGESYTLFARRIHGVLEGETLRDVIAEHDAVLLAEQLRVESPWLRIFFQEGDVHRMVATRPVPDSSASAAPPELASTLPQPRAIADGFWLMADSIDALAPAQRLDHVVAVGDAYGERVADSLATAVPDLVARDWLRGDTITGYFVERPVAATDGAADTTEATTQAVLERLVAVGPEGRARSLYRMREEGQDASARPSVNYLVANRIVLRMREGEVEDVEAEGPIQGLHLQPGKQPQAAENQDVRGNRAES